jgi:hypothetical protein
VLCTTIFVLRFFLDDEWPLGSCCKGMAGKVLMLGAFTVSCAPPCNGSPLPAWGKLSSSVTLQGFPMAHRCAHMAHCSTTSFSWAVAPKDCQTQHALRSVLCTSLLFLRRTGTFLDARVRCTMGTASFDISAVWHSHVLRHYSLILQAEVQDWLGRSREGLGCLLTRKVVEIFCWSVCFVLECLETLRACRSALFLCKCAAHMS